MLKQKKYIRMFSLAMLLICVVIFIKLTYNYQFIQDDAFTTFRYVKNFLSGKGLVFNAGEYVEGYTNFLWVMILSGLGYLGVNYIAVSQILSVLFGVLSLLIVYLFSAKFIFVASGKSYQKIFAIFPVYLLSVNGSFIYWSVSGMETSFFLVLILTGIYYFAANLNNQKYKYLYILFFILAAFTRPEGIFIFALLIVFKCWNLFNTKSELRKSIKIIGFETLIFAIPILAFTVFRLFYYGYLFPNTFYAKTGFTSFYLFRGLKYFWGFIDNPLMLAAIVSLILQVLLFRAKTKNLIILFIYYLVSIYLISIIIISGDVLPLYRFFLPVLPFIFILLSKFLFEVTIWFNDKFKLGNYIFIYVVIISVLSIGFVNLDMEKPVIEKFRSYELGLVYKMKIYAHWIKTQQIISGKKATVALSTIGAFSYYSDAKVIDIIGLTDEYIAHNPVKIEGIENQVSVLWKERHYNVDYVLKQKPDYIIFPAGFKPSAYPEAALFSRKEFQKKYYTQIFYSQNMNQMLPVFTRRNKLQQSIIADSIYNKPCNIKFVADYIDANNLLLNYIGSHNEKEKNQIIAKCKNAIAECSIASDKSLNALGMLFYHSGQYSIALKYFEKTININPMNSISHLYLKDIYSKLGNRKKMIQHLIKLKEISPDAFPNFHIKN